MAKTIWLISKKEKIKGITWLLIKVLYTLESHDSLLEYFTYTVQSMLVC